MSPTRRELVRATRARIVAAAGRLVDQRGPGGFSMDVLAKEAGVARATVYEHFRSKRAVLDELASTISETIVLNDQPAAAIEDPLVALRDMLGDICRHWSQHEQRIEGLRTLNAITGTGHGAEGVDDKHLQRLVEALSTAGQLRPHWSNDEAADALAALTSYATYERLRRGPRTPEQVEGVLAKLAIAIVTPGASNNVSTAGSAESTA